MTFFDTNIRVNPLVLFCLVIFPSMVLPSKIFSQTAREYHLQAIRAKNNFDYRGAEKLISKALEKSPDNMEYLLLRGDINLGLERYLKAKSDFESAIALDSMAVDPWIGRGRYYLYTGSPDSALYNAYVASILAESAYSEARANTALGEVLVAVNDTTNAYRHLNKGLALDTSNTLALKLLATLEITNGDYKAAREHLENARLYDQWDLETLINLAYTCNKMEDYVHAVEYCNMALTLDNNHPLALSNRAYAYLQLNQVEAALKNINKSIRNDNRNALAYKYKALILLEQDKVSAACRSLRKAEKFGYSVQYNDEVQNLMAEHCK